MSKGNFVDKAVEVGTVSVGVYFSDEDIAALYEYEPNAVKRLVGANIITEDEIENYLRESGYNPINDMVQEENVRLTEENEKLLNLVGAVIRLITSAGYVVGGE
tara:strand:- start:2356 stop:2667 length:312 start_codon:yes stop_codon:yes gene_type:complete